jgi:hypothetical protein
MVRRVATAVLGLVSLLALSAVVAQAAPTRSVNYTTAGSAEWDALYFPSTFTIHGRVYDGNAKVGAYTGTLLAGTYTGACFDGPYGPNCAPVTGTITYELRGGSITTEVQPGGLVTQLFTGSSQEAYIFDLTLSVTSGTHAYARAQGTLSLHDQTTRDNLSPDPVTLAPCYTAGIETCPLFDNGTLTGTIDR